MQVLISSEGTHVPPGHLVRVDHHQIVMDLSAVVGNLHDPSISRVEWGLIRDGRLDRPGGYIYRQDGTKQSFFDHDLIMPYVNAFNAKLAEITGA